MRERTGVLVGLLAGAAVGGVAGWLYLTEKGRRVRARIEPRLAGLIEQAAQIRVAAARTEAAARQGVRSAKAAVSRAAGPDVS